MTEIKILTTPGCSHCKEAEEVIEKVKKDYPKLRYVVIDLTKHPEYLQKYQVMASPGIVIDGKLEFIGGLTEKQLRSKLKR